MKYFMLLCVLVVVGVSARPSALVDLDVQDFDFKEAFTKYLSKIKMVSPMLASTREIETEDFDLEDITGALAKISSAWSGIVTNKLGPALNGLPLGALGKLGKRDLPVELQDTDWDAVLGHIVGIAGDVMTNAATVLPPLLGALGGQGKREIGDNLDVQDFPPAWFAAMGFIDFVINPLIGKRGVETEDFDLEDITGTLAKVSHLWSQQVKTKIAPALAKQGIFGQLGALGK